ncbi:MAG: hypothetical protein A2X25_05560 [Chloroflexi bacterium GWB2_49_20]|nr:MAG: hypothetical protein A2X25_05560 [Chloroflexi bacterium GWB2_49_20]OGN77093.1 MAG: hypothetical protein A2X26_06560 [Chloroflexi bacterium GWC2_49_37]OGN83819.1 MAG: hypothetical protein A2X27_02160 [Chloroflexi bacterium GWD2_49_16]
MKRIILSLTVLVLISLACGQTAQLPASSPSPSPSSTPTTPAPLANPDFTIAIEYGILGVADFYIPTGVKYAKLQDAFAIWGNIEPEPGVYTWEPLDALVLEYQQAGFTGLQMNLAALSPWAASKPPALGDQGDTFPKPEYLDDYAAFVTATVERYDSDGVEDMPGLLFPVREYGIEREFTGFWPGSAEEYVRLLRIAYPAVKSADPQANVLLVALLMTDIFDGAPDTTELNRRLATPVDYMRKSVPEIQTILAACDAYDMVDFHSLGNYTEIPPTTTWIRAQLQQNGCGEKPIWIGDAFPMSGLVGFGGFVPPTPFSPVTLATRDDMVALLTDMADPGTPGYPAARDWIYSETAIGLVRKLVVSAGEGLRGINIGNLEDWKTSLAGVDKLAVPMLGASMFMGLTNTDITNQKPGGELPFDGKEWSQSRRASDPRPAFYSLGLVINKIAQFSSVTRVDLGPDVWAYEFETPNGLVWVLWYDDGQLHLPGDDTPSQSVSLPLPAGFAHLTRTPTQFGQSQLEVQDLTVPLTMLDITLIASPVFIEVAP